MKALLAPLVLLRLVSACLLAQISADRSGRPPPRPAAQARVLRTQPSTASDAPLLPSPRVAAPLTVPYQPAVREDGRRVVALDIGHSVAQHGSTSARGKGEFYFNQRIVRLLQARLEKSTIVAPFIINPDGATIALSERPKIAARRGAELFLSVHHDAANEKYLTTWDPDGSGKSMAYSDRFRGYGTFVSRKNPQADRSFAFAQLLGAAMRGQRFTFARHHNEPIPGENRPILDEERGVYRYDDLVVLKYAPMPAALLECGVIIHRDAELELERPETHARIVEAITGAIEAFFRVPQTARRSSPTPGSR